ncbi:IclR family transcriptional regulator [Mesorhizobium microcysteis]|uniref:IclR family transcriptional regulator n=1 Tax=Neoaquamicrobium microcysteis TaxID=2682781 RepID=A0A5D4GL85_9HYPH|nr:IclR family transcriptional regulator [Mesorhizobium microcysteis]TYR29601.1 IclR family transcriptional regulator [Mesorhizobium microcysteis]
MSGAIDKTLGILEFLAARPQGAELVEIATDLNQSRSGCHRTLLELVGYGYVRQTQRGAYRLTTKLPAMGLNWLSKSGLVDIAQPALRRLAESSRELVRLGIVDGDRMTLVAKAQGVNSGVLYDPDMGIDLKLSCSAAGHALLMTLSDEEAALAVSKQGFGNPKDFGPNAPTTLPALLAMLQEHRMRGFSLIRDVYAPGMSSMAAPVQRRGEGVTAAVVIAGPSIRFTEERMLACGSDLLATAGELALLGNASPLLESRDEGTWGNRG